MILAISYIIRELLKHDKAIKLSFVAQKWHHWILFLVLARCGAAVGVSDISRTTGDCMTLKSFMSIREKSASWPKKGFSSPRLAMSPSFLQAFCIRQSHYPLANAFAYTFPGTTIVKCQYIPLTHIGFVKMERCLSIHHCRYGHRKSLVWNFLFCDTFRAGSFNNCYMIISKRRTTPWLG